MTGTASLSDQSAGARPAGSRAGASRSAGAELDPIEQVGQAFKGAMAALRRLRGRETHHPGELSDAQYSLLFCLRGHDAVSTGELAEAADLSPASATEMLDGLAAHGLVARVRSDRDRRVVLTSLTPRGRDLVEERRARIEPRYRAAMAEFNDQELLAAAAVLDRLRGLFDEFADERRSRG
ncbi:MAG: MarR family transcriptional regulator [Solirubrobacterales bacterium]|nr:MarR family transcriptional regulator [Solirubrobacterales bacterium]